MNSPDFSLDDIKFFIDEPTFKRAVVLYKAGKVLHVKEGIRSYSGVVEGTKQYRVSVEARNFRYSHCECYLGERDILCKHSIALALYVVKDSAPLTQEDLKFYSLPVCSADTRGFAEGEKQQLQSSITKAKKYISPYSGPSSAWFHYQDRLSQGCARLSKALSLMPINTESTDMIIKLLISLDKKLCSDGVDDSNGVVGGFMEDAVAMLLDFTSCESNLALRFKKLEKISTCFDWDKPLIEKLHQLNS